MLKRIVSGIILILILMSILTLAFHIQPVKAAMKIVPDDYRTIQEAINAANPRDAIQVRVGTYYENVVVNKTISLVGENSNTTVIDGNGTWLNVITIAADCVNIAGFSITGGDSAICFPRHCSNTSIINCNIYNNDKGVSHSEPCSRTSVIECDIFNNRYGISLCGSSHVIGNCNVFSNDLDGIFLSTPSDRCIIANCSVWNNKESGISVPVSSYHVIKNSYIFNNTMGVSFIGNGINSVTDHTVTNCYISNNTYGVYLSSTLYSHITVTNCNISNNEWGVYLGSYSNWNHIYHNNFISNANQAKDQSTNLWDDDYPSGGNYWDNYTGLDLYSGLYQNETGSDGIGDKPYIIEGGGVDEYPLMNPRPLPEMQKTDYEFYGLLAKFYRLLAEYKKLESKYDNSQASYYNLSSTHDDLLANYTSLQAELNDLQSELNTTQNTMYTFLITTMVLIVTTVYLAMRKSKSKT